MEEDIEKDPFCIIASALANTMKCLEITQDQLDRAKDPEDFIDIWTHESTSKLNQSIIDTLIEDSKKRKNKK